MKNVLKDILKYVFILLISCGFTLIPNRDINIISYTTILSALIDIFSVSLAIVAIFFTVLDRYKDNVADKSAFIKSTNRILTEMIDNTIGLFIMIIALFISSIFKGYIEKIKFIDFGGVILIFCLILSVLAIFDIIISVRLLICGLQDFTDVNDKNFGINENEKNLVQSFRKLNSASKSELKEYIKTLIVKQEINNNEKKQQK